MKVLMDGRNHGAGLNSSSPCSTACSINKNDCVKGYLPIPFCWTVKVYGYNPKNSSNV
ncbi:hypothetical protein GKF99_00445 [Finegoldia sp. BIOML-A2]|uniref:hypothetical protein n=1 Tax=Finegoldia TaxID=150022 RepID=UPI0012B074F4|nr:MULTISPECIES: hypothetical protein [Finegoldia]MDU1398708.1 hypothetical protein [Finegoldia magna]MDU2219061.1 hypothetical protein [Finegoldia magna]MDU5199950.1 hypothetical protein [Finegoldia magna]MDU6774917.1 hypothetical protein [Finegoldia magna]MSA96512.1 hypothetical protein [Finegoldia sp. BIOML-A5]